MLLINLCQSATAFYLGSIKERLYEFLPSSGLTISDTELVRSHLEWRYSISGQGTLLMAIFSLTFERGDSCISRPLTKYDSAERKCKGNSRDLQAERGNRKKENPKETERRQSKKAAGSGGTDGPQSPTPWTTELAKRTVCPH